VSEGLIVSSIIYDCWTLVAFKIVVLKSHQGLAYKNQVNNQGTLSVSDRSAI